MIYFTSDLHLGHAAIIHMQNRPFESVEEMNEKLIENFNQTIHQGDTVYILGDIAFRVKMETANEMISKLNGRKILINGNHDKKYDPSLFVNVTDYMTSSFNGRPFVLMHYPMLSWPHKSRGAIQLHGHIHARMDYNMKNREAGGLRYDVGVDANDYKPVSVNQIIEFFKDADCKP